MIHIVRGMDFDYDPAKDEANRFKHGLSLAFGRHVLDAMDCVIAETFRVEDEEQRFKAIGTVGGKLHTAVYCWRGDTIRMISVRRSNANEQRLHDRDSGRSP